ncbi:MAG: hypothetical protein EBX40_00535 [Gammaproteobacteria bacterium]|nr:hypothetical protein [Gammaproteobacteria bacterium]
MENLAKTDFFPTSMFYETACKHWDENDWPRIPIESLPQKMIGSFFEDHDEILAFAFLYHTNSNLAWFEWLTCSKEIRKDKRSQILASTIEFAEKYAKENKLVLFTTVKNVNLISRLQSRGWKTTDSGMTNFIFS